jgi:hypothetical protein
LCYVNKYPLKIHSRNYKTKEKCVVDYVIDNYPDFTWRCDKQIENGCSKRRPDLFLDLGTHILIIEIDEEKHVNYSCENKRIMELSQDLGFRPIIFIRFNPDKYTNKNGKKITSCWKVNELGLIQLVKTTEKEWKNRLQKLKEEIQKCLEVDESELKMININYLFYD